MLFRSLTANFDIPEPKLTRQVRLALPLQPIRAVRPYRHALHNFGLEVAAGLSHAGELRDGRGTARSGGAVGMESEGGEGAH